LITRRQFGHSIRAAGAAGLTFSVPALAAPYGQILPPEPPRITTPRKTGEGARNISSGQSLTVSDAWWSDKWIGIKANGTTDMGPVHFTDVRLERYGPMIVMRGSPEILLDRIESFEARPSSYGMGFLRATDRIGRLRARNLKLVGAREINNTNDAFAAICLWGKGTDDVCRDWEISRFDLRNLIMKKGERYRNADGISVERGHDDGLIENGMIRNVSDAGIDCKGANCRITQVDITGARENLKLWDSSTRHGRIISRSPRFAHIIVASSSGQGPIVIDQLECHGDPKRPVIAFEGSSREVVVRTLVAPEGQVLYTADDRSKAASLRVNGTKVF
jgi:hypothetical protein